MSGARTRPTDADSDRGAREAANRGQSYKVSRKEKDPRRFLGMCLILGSTIYKRPRKGSVTYTRHCRVRGSWTIERNVSLIVA